MPLRPPSGEYALYEMPFALQNRAVLSSPPLVVFWRLLCAPMLWPH